MISTGTLELARVAARQHITEELLTGIHHAELAAVFERVWGNLVLELNGYVLTETGGDTVTDSVTALLPLRPRWLPRWLWRRIPTRSVRWTLTARPVFRYPRASVAVPALGAPVRFVVADAARPTNVDWRTDNLGGP